LALFGLSLCFNSFGQNSYPSLSSNEDTLYLSSTCKFYVEQDIKFGEGTTDDGSFKYIRISSGSMFHYTATQGHSPRAANEANALPSSFNNGVGHVKKIMQRRAGRKGNNVFYLKLGVGLINNYECDITSALKSGEITCIGCENFMKSNTQTVIVQQNSSNADELIKLKKLKDDGILTEEEYQEQKKKLLSK
jgi:hypothetical protein